MMMSLALIGFSFFLQSCKSLAQRSQTSTSPGFISALRVDELVQSRQSSWLKGLVLDPDVNEIKQLIVFGDSYSDTGQLNLLDQTIAPAQIFWHSRFSNGPIWVDYVQSTLGWSVRNYSYLDQQELQKAQTIPLTSIKAQVQYFSREAKGMSRAGSVVVMWLSPDFYLHSSAPGSLALALADLRDGIALLAELGFYHIAIGNMPDLTLLPKPANPIPPNQTKVHNDGLKQLIADLNKKNLLLRLFFFQAFEIEKYSLEMFEGSSLQAENRSCIKADWRGKTSGSKGFCKQPKTMRFWDERHPSSRMHCFFAAQLLADLADNDRLEGYNRLQAIDRCQHL